MPIRNPQTAKSAWAPGRILAIDLGDKRIGLAISNTARTVATPSPAVPRTLWKTLQPTFQSLIHIHAVTGIIMGYPLDMNGAEGPKAQSCKDFATLLETTFGIQILLWDERLTSKAAEQAWFEQRQIGTRQTRASKKQSVGHIDSAAATLLLESALPTLR